MNIFYALIARRLTRRLLTIVVLVSGACLLAQDYFTGGIFGGNEWNNLYDVIARVAFPFFCGVLLYNIHASGRLSVFHRAAMPLTVGLLGILLFPFSQGGQVFAPVAIMLAFPAIVFFGALDEPSPRVRALFLALGRLSYPLYILHSSVLKVFANYFFAHHLSGWRLYLGFIIELLAAMAFAYCVMILVDNPVRAFLSRRWARAGSAVKTIRLVPSLE